jgi:hypothetical protein
MSFGKYIFVRKITWSNKRHLIVMLLVGFLLVIGMIALFQIFRIPSEQKNAWLFGFSRARILIGGGMISALLFLGIIELFTYSQSAWWQNTLTKIKELLLARNNLFWIVTLLYLFIIFTLVPLAFTVILPEIRNLVIFRMILERIGFVILWIYCTLIIFGIILYLNFSKIIIAKRIFLTSKLAGGVFIAAYTIYQLFSYLLGWVGTPPKAYWHLLAQAFLHGKLYFLDTPSITHDLTFYLGHWYLPPPPLPAIILMPYVMLVGLGNVNTVLFSILFASINSMIVFLILDRLRNLEWIKLNRSDSLWLVVLFTFGTPHFYMGIIGMEWQISKVLAVTFLALSIYSGLKGWSAWLVGLCLGLAMASRPNLFVIWPLLFAIAIQIVKDDNHRELKWKWLVKWVAASAIPVVVVVIGLLLYNYLRFGNPMDFGYVNINGSTQIVENVRKYGIYNLHFIPVNLSVMFSQLPSIRSYSPYLFPSLDGMSMLITTPALFLLIHRYEKKWWIIGTWTSVILSVILLSMYHNTGAAQFGYGYIMDFIIPLMMLLAVALGRKCSWIFRLLVIISVGINGFGVWWFLQYA